MNETFSLGPGGIGFALARLSDQLVADQEICGRSPGSDGRVIMVPSW